MSDDLRARIKAEIRELRQNDDFNGCDFLTEILGELVSNNMRIRELDDGMRHQAMLIEKQLCPPLQIRDNLLYLLKGGSDE